MEGEDVFDDFIEKQMEMSSNSPENTKMNNKSAQNKPNGGLKENKLSIVSISDDFLLNDNSSKNNTKNDPPGIANEIINEEASNLENTNDNNDKLEELSEEELAARRRFRKELCGKALLIVISRLLYTLHVLLTIWRVTAVLGTNFWYMACWIMTFLVESIVVIVFRKGKEWTWFQPIVMLYLMVELPGIWLLEMEKASAVQDSFNRTIILDQIYGTGAEVTKFKVNNLNVRINSNTWALLLEQSMLVLIIGARWLMPKGELTKEQLSGLLLSYLGTASDAVDFFSVLAEEPKLLLKLSYLFTILSVWSWSMLQFMFVVTMTVQDGGENGADPLQPSGASDNRIAPDVEANNILATTSGGGVSDNETKPEMTSESSNTGPRIMPALDKPPKKKSTCRAFVESEIWSIFVSVVLQDGPYVVVRLTCVFYWGIRTYTNYFFTAKNCMMLALQIYRIVGVYQNESSKSSEKEKLGKTV